MKRIHIIFLTFFCFASLTFSQEDIKPYLDNANRLANQKKYFQAIDEINKAIAIESNNADLYIRRAKFYKYIKNKEEVLKNVNLAININPYDAQVLLDGAIQLNLDGQFEESLKLANDLLRIEPSNYFGYKIRYQTKYELKDYAGTFEDVMRAIETLPPANEHPQFTQDMEFPMLFSLLNKHLNEDQNIFDYYRRSIELFEKKAKSFADNPPQFSTSKERNEEVVNFTTERIQEKIGVLYATCAKLYEEHEQPVKSAELLEKFVQTEPRDLHYQMRAGIFQDKGNYQEAIADLTQSIALSGSKRKAKPLMLRGDLYLLIKQYDKAIADFEAAISFDTRVASTGNEKIGVAKQKMQETANHLR